MEKMTHDYVRQIIPVEKFTSDATLITIAADALAELASETYDGKTIVFTVRGNFSSAKIAATLKYAPELRRVKFNGLTVGHNEEYGYYAEADVENGEGIAGYEAEGDYVKFDSEIFVNGVSKGTHTFEGVSSATTPLADVSPGDTVKVVLHMNPERTEFEQDDVSREAAVS